VLQDPTSGERRCSRRETPARAKPWAVGLDRDLSARIVGLPGEIAGLPGEIAEFAGAIGELSAEIVEVSAPIDHLRGEIGDVSVAIADLASEIAYRASQRADDLARKLDDLDGKSCVAGDKLRSYAPNAGSRSNKVRLHGDKMPFLGDEERLHGDKRVSHAEKPALLDVYVLLLARSCGSWGEHGSAPTMQKLVPGGIIPARRVYVDDHALSCTCASPCTVTCTSNLHGHVHGKA